MNSMISWSLMRGMEGSLSRPPARRDSSMMATISGSGEARRLASYCGVAGEGWGAARSGCLASYCGGTGGRGAPRSLTVAASKQQMKGREFRAFDWDGYPQPPSLLCLCYTSTSTYTHAPTLIPPPTW